MSSSTATALRQPQNLTELLDGRPDTREMISANLNLAHACLLLKQGESEEVERALDLAQRTRSTGLESITRCVRAEVLRVTGKTEEAWDMAEALVHENRFDTVAALYLRFLFPFRPVPSAPAEPEELPVEAPPTVAAVGESEFVSQKWDEDPPAPARVLEPESPSPAEAPLVPPQEAAASLADSQAVSVTDPESEIALDLEVPAPAPRDAQTAPHTTGELPAVLEKIAQDGAIRLLRVQEPDGSVSEAERAFPTEHSHIEDALVKRPAKILKSLGFGSLAHASFEHAAGAAHSWIRKGRTLVLVVDGATAAPALAARCTRAMEDS